MPAERRIALLLCLLLPWAATAVTGDSEQPITVDADNVEVNHTTGVGVYSGDVVIRQGTLEIRATRAEIRVSDDGPDRVIIDGAPATFQQEEDDGSTSAGRAAHMEYMSDEGVIRLTGEAWVRVSGNELSGDVIDYDLGDEVARVGGDETEDAPAERQRVRVVIEPRSQADGDDG